MPSPRPRPPREYVVHLDTRATDRMYVGVLGIWVALLLVGVAGFVLILTGVIGGTGAVAGPLIFVLVCVPNLVIYGWIWRSTRRLGTPAVVRPREIFFRTPRGEVTVPWEAVRDVTVSRAFGQDQLNVLLYPAVGPGSPGITSTLSTGAWSTVRKSGLRLSFRVVTENPVEVLAAITELSDGRFTPTLPVRAAR